MENILQKADKIDLVYAINEPSAYGGYAALKAAGKEKGVTVVAVDGGCQGVKWVKEGIIGATSQQYPLLISDMWVTIFEVLYGFVLAAVVGVPLALAIFYSPIVGKSIYPILVALQTVPKVALAPILMLWFGFGLIPLSTELSAACQKSRSSKMNL